jgi:hypothetical protein
VSERVEAIEDRIDEIARELSQLRKQQSELADRPTASEGSPAS